MDLPTYTSIWRIEKRLYKLYDFRLPMPLPIGQVTVFAAIAVPYVVLLTMLGLPFNHTLIWLYILPPGFATWLATRPVLESKRLPELIKSQLRYLAEPRVLCRMAALSERDVVVVTGRVWRPRASRRMEKRALAAAVAADADAAAADAAAAADGAASAGSAGEAVASAAFAERWPADGSVAAAPADAEPARPRRRPLGPGRAQTAARSATASPANPGAVPAWVGGRGDRPAGPPSAWAPGPLPSSPPGASARSAGPRASWPAGASAWGGDAARARAASRAGPAEPRLAARGRSAVPAATPPAAASQGSPIEPRAARPTGLAGPRSAATEPPAAPGLPPAAPGQADSADSAATAAPQVPVRSEAEQRSPSPAFGHDAQEPRRPRPADAESIEGAESAETTVPAEGASRAASAVPAEHAVPSGHRVPPDIVMDGAVPADWAQPPPAATSVPAGPATQRPAVTVVGSGAVRATPPAVERALAGPSARRGDVRADRVTVVPGGHRPGKPDLLQRDRARVQLPIGGPAKVVVLGCTVGAGQTMTTLLTGEVLASLRSDRIAVLDLNPGAGSLAGRAESRPAPSQAASVAVSRLGVISPPRGGTAGPRGEDEQATLRRDPAADVAAFEAAGDRNALVLADPATAAVPRLLAVADQLVLVAPASAAAPGAIAMTFEWLEAHGQASLAAGAVMVLNGVSRRSLAIVEQAERVCAGRCRAIVRVPWDDQLQSHSVKWARPAAPGSQARQHWAGLLTPATAGAYTALAGVLVASLADRAADRSGEKQSAPLGQARR